MASFRPDALDRLGLTARETRGAARGHRHRGRGRTRVGAVPEPARGPRAARAPGVQARACARPPTPSPGRSARARSPARRGPAGRSGSTNRGGYRGHLDTAASVHATPGSDPALSPVRAIACRRACSGSHARRRVGGHGRRRGSAAASDPGFVAELQPRLGGADTVHAYMLGVMDGRVCGAGRRSAGPASTTARLKTVAGAPCLPPCSPGAVDASGLRAELSAQTRTHVGGARTLRALLHLVQDLRALRQRLEAAAGDRGMVDEHVLAFVVGRDETKPGGRTSIQSAFCRRATPPHAAWRQERLKPCPGGRVASCPTRPCCTSSPATVRTTSTVRPVLDALKPAALPDHGLAKLEDAHGHIVYLRPAHVTFVESE